jgi:hypothetical protein
MLEERRAEKKLFASGNRSVFRVSFQALWLISLGGENGLVRDEA